MSILFKLSKTSAIITVTLFFLLSCWSTLSGDLWNICIFFFFFAFSHFNSGRVWHPILWEKGLFNTIDPIIHCYSVAFKMNPLHVCVWVGICVYLCEAVNLSSPAPSKKTDSPLRRMLQRKITTPADKHTLVSVQTQTLRQKDALLHLNRNYSLLFTLTVMCEIVTLCFFSIAVNWKYWLLLHWMGNRLSLRGRVWLH